MSDELIVDPIEQTQTVFQKIKRGTVVREKQGRKSGIILWGDDPHNIQVQWSGGEIKFFCVDKECKCYDGDKIDIRFQDIGDVKDML